MERKSSLKRSCSSDSLVLLYNNHKSLKKNEPELSNSSYIDLSKDLISSAQPCTSYNIQNQSSQSTNLTQSSSVIYLGTTHHKPELSLDRLNNTMSSYDLASSSNKTIDRFLTRSTSNQYHLSRWPPMQDWEWKCWRRRVHGESDHDSDVPSQASSYREPDYTLHEYRSQYMLSSYGKISDELKSYYIMKQIIDLFLKKKY